jgi:phosphoheptose isomerase
MTGFGFLAEHLGQLRGALRELERQGEVVERWGIHVASVLGGDGRLLAAGNGGSAAQAQHLTAELVGRFEGERRALSAIALTSETSTLTAVGNDYGYDEVFARQVQGHGRAGDVLVLLTTSGRSRNLLRAADRGRAAGLRVLALTGPRPNPLAEVSDEVLAVDSPSTTAVQEVHLVVVHALCAAVERHLRLSGPVPARDGRPWLAGSIPLAAEVG